MASVRGDGECEEAGEAREGGPEEGCSELGSSSSTTKKRELPLPRSSSSSESDTGMMGRGSTGSGISARSCNLARNSSSNFVLEPGASVWCR